MPCLGLHRKLYVYNMCAYLTLATPPGTLRMIIMFGSNDTVIICSAHLYTSSWVQMNRKKARVQTETCQHSATQTKERKDNEVDCPHDLFSHSYCSIYSHCPVNLLFCINKNPHPPTQTICLRAQIGILIKSFFPRTCDC